MVEATAPGKIILFGEHAVVYGYPAIAVPLSQARAKAMVQFSPHQYVQLCAPDLGIDINLEQAGGEDAIAIAVRQVQYEANLQQLQHMTITVTSDIPIASGLGSGASITAAVIRALASYLDLEYLVTEEWVSRLTYEVEKVHHGTPSGIDNTVVAYEQPVYFKRQQPRNLIEPFKIAQPLRLLVGDTGVSSSTKTVVTDVRRSWQANPERFNLIFEGCGQITLMAREAIETGDQIEIGRLMNRNHALLVDMTVSSPELNHLVQASLDAGALGAKMSGGGRGGNMIALVTEESENNVYYALKEAGARSILRNVIS